MKRCDNSKRPSKMPNNNVSQAEEIFTEITHDQRL